MTPEANIDSLFRHNKVRPAARDIGESRRWVDAAQFMAAKRLASQAHDLGDLSVDLRHDIRQGSIAFCLAHLGSEPRIHPLYAFRYETSAGFTLAFHYLYDSGKEADLVVSKSPDGDNSFEIRRIIEKGPYGDQIFVSEPLLIESDGNMWRSENIDKLASLLKRRIDPEKDHRVVDRFHT